MTKTILLEKTTEIKRTLKELEEKLKVKLSLKRKKLTISGPTINEYDASQVIDAINFGFSTDKALLLKDPDFSFRKLHIKDFTRRSNLREVRARIIGSNGRTKRTIENISNTDIILNDNEVGIIGSSESIEEAVTAMANIIKGSKQSNVYKYLEKANVLRKDSDLGLKD